jgi:hypothetical protein
MRSWLAHAWESWEYHIALTVLIVATALATAALRASLAVEHMLDVLRRR